MKKINIIKENKDFATILNKRKFSKNKYYTIYYNDKSEKYYRFGLSVGKKISKRAVDRNKLKRRLKSIIDNNKNYYQNSKDYIIIMKGSCLEATYSELEKAFQDIMNNINKGEKNETKQ